MGWQIGGIALLMAALAVILGGEAGIRVYRRRRKGMRPEGREEVQ